MIAVECVILAEAGNHLKKKLQTSLTLALLRSAAVSWNLELFEDRHWMGAKDLPFMAEPSIPILVTDLVQPSAHLQK